MNTHLISGISLIALLTACGGESQDTDNATTAAPETEAAARAPETDAPATDAVPTLPALTAETVDRHMSMLASDEFGGRAPATAGGQRTREYLIEQMQAIGLEPGNGDSYEQPVGLVEQTVIADQSGLSLTLADGTERPLTYGAETVFWSKRVEENLSYDDSELVFVGFGVVAPEYGWNDYEGIDVEGKTVVMLVNDPGYYREGDIFNGRAMTYYGRWTYKFEEAARQGAAGAIVIHQTAPASYGWGVVEGSWSGPQLDLERPDGGANRAILEGWVTEEVARELFTAAGMDLDTSLEFALSGEFTPQAMGGISVSASMRNVINRSASANVAGVIRGTTHPDDHVLYMAHWDHLGQTFAAIGGGDNGGDTINNGAVDNATGTAALLTIAESFTTADTPPERSIIFVAVTGRGIWPIGLGLFRRRSSCALPPYCGRHQYRCHHPLWAPHEI